MNRHTLRGSLPSASWCLSSLSGGCAARAGCSGVEVLNASCREVSSRLILALQGRTRPEFESLMREFSNICIIFLEKPARILQLLGTVQLLRGLTLCPSLVLLCHISKVLTDKELHHLQLMHLDFEQD